MTEKTELKPVERKDVVYLIEDCGGYYMSGLGEAAKGMDYRGLRQVQKTLIRELCYLNERIIKAIPDNQLVTKQLDTSDFYRSLLVQFSRDEEYDGGGGQAIVAAVVKGLEDCELQAELGEVTDEDLRHQLGLDEDDEEDDDEG